MAFFDLNVPMIATEGDAKNHLQALREYGWSNVAYSTTVSSNKLQELKSVQFRELEFEKESMVIKTVSAKKALLQQLKAMKRDPVQFKKDGNPSDAFRQLYRATIILDDSSNQTNKNQELLSKFHIIAVQPTTEKSFILACQNLDIDIISLDLSSRLPFYLKNTTVNVAIQKGIVFEINYTQLLKDSSTRRNVISNMSSLIRVTGGKNIIFSSGSDKYIELRGPHDIINLGSLFNLSADKVQQWLQKFPEQALYHAATRSETYRGAISVERIQQ